jgi:hypothetical protein
MTIRMGDAAYRALRRRYAELEAIRLTADERRMTVDEWREWYSVNTQMTEAELEYPDGSYRPIAAVADAEDYALELRLAGALGEGVEL